MANTTRWGHPYPVSTDPPAGHTEIQALALSVDGVAMDDQGTLANRPVSTSGNPGKKGRYYFVAGDGTPANNGILWRDNGTGWDAITPGDDSIVTAKLADGAVTGPKLAAGVGGGDYGTAFPTTGLFNGYGFTIFLADVNGGYVACECVYRVDLDATYPWHVRGCPPVNVAAAANFASTGSYTAIVAWTAPRSGRYAVSSNGRGFITGWGATVALRNNGSIVRDNGTFGVDVGGTTGAGGILIDHREITVISGQNVDVAGETNGSGGGGGSTAQWYASLSVTPIRLV